MKTSREKILIQTSWVSATGNFVLSAAKIFVGLFAGSLAVLGDGIDSAVDVIISFIMIFAARIVNRPPDRKYVYGYEKVESIAAKILSLIIFYAGAQMLVVSTSSIFSDEPRNLPGMLTIYVTIFSIAGKFLLAVYQYRQGKKIKSSMLIANAVNMKNDILISLGTLIGLIFTFLLELPVLDAIVGMIISLFIIKSAFDIFKETYVELMDGVKDETVYDKIFEAVKKVPGAHNPHRVRTRQIGNSYMISLDIEADGNISLNEAHKIADEVEQSIKQSIESVYDIVVHVEPEGKHHSKEQFGLSEIKN